MSFLYFKLPENLNVVLLNHCTVHVLFGNEFFLCYFLSFLNWYWHYHIWIEQLHYQRSIHKRQHSFLLFLLVLSEKIANKKINCVRLTNYRNHLKNNLQFEIQNLNCLIVGTHCSIFGTPYTCSFCVKNLYFKNTVY